MTSPDILTRLRGSLEASFKRLGYDWEVPEDMPTDLHMALYDWRGFWTIKDVDEWVSRWTPDPESLPIEAEPLQDTVEPPGQPSRDWEALEILSRVLTNLDTRSYHVLTNRYGFFGKTKTLAQLSQEVGVTPAQVRQIQVQSERRLQGLTSTDKLRDELIPV
jgi:hypothetical protein